MAFVVLASTKTTTVLMTLNSQRDRKRWKADGEKYTSTWKFTAREKNEKSWTRDLMEENKKYRKIKAEKWEKWKRQKNQLAECWESRGGETGAKTCKKKGMFVTLILRSKAIQNHYTFLPLHTSTSWISYYDKVIVSRHEDWQWFHPTDQNNRSITESHYEA